MSQVTIVWEWLDNDGLWKAYEPSVSDHIETNFQSPISGHLQLGTFCPSLVHYSLDLKQSVQINVFTGSQRQVRRSQFAPDSPAAKGITWFWSGDHAGHWNPYDMETMAFLEAEMTRGNQADLQQLPNPIPYIVDFKAWTQTNVTSGFSRSVRRVTGGQPYTVVNTAATAATSGSVAMKRTSSVPAKSGTRSKLSCNQGPSSLSLSAIHGNVPFPGVAFNHAASRFANYSRPVPGFTTTMTENYIDEPNFASSNDVISLYSTPVAPPDEDCSICRASLKDKSDMAEDGDDDVILALKKCKHTFHGPCLTAMYNSGAKSGSIQCPTCKETYGQKRGNCPDGVMKYYLKNGILPGHAESTMIVIEYIIKPGLQREGHPNPGKPYIPMGFPRTCYLPNVDEGRKILKLLIEAWRRRLTFTIGTSVTTGQPDAVVWNEIHHKTESGSNRSGHGYPDPNYFANVRSELEAQGVTEQLMTSSSDDSAESTDSDESL